MPRNDSFNEAGVTDKPSLVANMDLLSDEAVARMDQNYADGLRSLMRLDRFTGNASKLLKSKGEMRNTYFVFYSDNWSRFRQHRLPHGKLMPYKEDTNFPLIVRGPGIPEGEEREQLVGSHDIAPTLALVGGATIPAFVDRRSFLQVARNSSATWNRTAVLSERTIATIPPAWEMLRMKDSNYTRYGDSPDKEYYDLTLDPLQLHNAFGTSDTDYPPPDAETEVHLKTRLDALATYTGRGERTGSRSEAGNAPLSPTTSAP